MTEYNRESGILTLSLKDAHALHRTADRMPDEKPPIEFYAKKLRKFGYEVSSVTEESLEVNALEIEIWNLLSGQHAYL